MRCSIDRAVVYYLDWARARLQASEAFSAAIRGERPETRTEPLDPSLYVQVHVETQFGDRELLACADELFSFLNDPVHTKPKKIRSMSVGDLVAVKFLDGETVVLVCAPAEWTVLTDQGLFEKLASDAFNPQDRDCIIW